MEFKINPAEICNVFVVPASVVDEDLRLAGSAQLKVLLWTLRHSKHENATVQELSDELGLDKADVLDAMQFWLDRGVLLKQGEAPALQANTKPPAKSGGRAAVTPIPIPAPVQAEAKPAVAELPMSKPSLEQIAVRCKESRELRDLFEEVQKQLGRTIGYEGQSVLVMMFDTYGLPMSVILMAVEYAVSQGKTSMKYISSIGKLWCDKEIDTLEKALEFIDEMNSCDGIWERFRQLTGLKNPKPTTSQRGYLITWTKQFGYGIDMIYLAYEEMVDRTQKFSMQYIDRILANWHSQGVKTPDDVEKAKLNYKNSAASSKVRTFPKNGADASYDLDEYERKAKQTPPVYKKKSGS